MKVLIRNIRLPEPSHYDRTGKAVAWTPMVIEVLAEEPEDAEDAERQYVEARGWAFPSGRHGNLRGAPPVLELLPVKEKTDA